MMQKNYVMGTLCDVTGVSINNPCNFCKRDTFFTDKWDWKKQIPICVECAMNKGIIKESDVVVTQETEQRTKDILGITDYDLEVGISKMMRFLKKGGGHQT